ncbi:hypothetical protein AeMF1_004845 [Aphanomyces euteiches]|nr:hypothetical protein AeMF1_004845 [Aphanomyces euteiches]KAH9185597.1 hypothetical protein AeNC1_012425 [Aphanomyces euteiches]
MPPVDEKPPSRHRSCTLPCRVGIADNEDLANVAAFADAFLPRNLSLHILLLNAGQAFRPYHEIHNVESTVLINHVAHHLLATRLLPVLKHSARIVIVSSKVHTVPKHSTSSCPPKRQVQRDGVSKAATILMGHSLLKQIGADYVYANRLHPGRVTTPTPDKKVVLTQFPDFVSKSLGFLLNVYVRSLYCELNLVKERDPP